MRELYAIQYLRAFAAIGVVCFHASEQFNGSFELGAAGVDVFFVISGFIMWVTTAGKPSEPWRFMSRRVVRIVPLYWIVTSCTAAAILLKPQFLYGHVLSAQNFAGSLFFVPIIKDDQLHPVVIQGWTLCYEMFFYALFAAALVLEPKARLQLLIGSLIALALSHPFLPPGYPSVLSDPIISEFAAGAAIGWLWTRKLDVPFPAALSTLAAGVLLLIFLNMFAEQLDRALRHGLPAAMIVFGAAFAERARPLQPIGVLRFLGEASYSIYIWHVLVGAVLTGILLRLSLPLWLQPALLVTLSVIAASLLYLTVERPMTRLLRERRTVQAA